VLELSLLAEDNECNSTI